ncbi:MAG: cupin domain-containing protein [Actinobacteria bacterium]|nr:cupin domain-containing protein [Actinomycetota bacterium]
MEAENNAFKLSQIKKTQFEDRWVKFAFGPQGFKDSKNLNLGIVDFNKNSTALNHRHDVEEALFVLSGKGKIKIGPETFDLEKNDFAYIPAKTDHQVITGDQRIKILFIFGGEIFIDH